MDETREQLAVEMNTARKRRRMTWSEVATAAGMTQQHLLRIRNGTVPISEDAAYGIEQALGWPEGYIERRLRHESGTAAHTGDVASEAARAEAERRLARIKARYPQEYEIAMRALRQLDDDAVQHIITD